VAGHADQDDSPRSFCAAAQSSRRRVQLLLSTFRTNVLEAVSGLKGKTRSSCTGTICRRAPTTRQQYQVGARHLAGHITDLAVFSPRSASPPSRIDIDRVRPPVTGCAGDINATNQVAIAATRRLISMSLAATVIPDHSPPCRRSIRKAPKRSRFADRRGRPNGTITQIPLTKLPRSNWSRRGLYLPRTAGALSLPVKSRWREPTFGGAVREPGEGRIPVNSARDRISSVGIRALLQDAIKRLSIVVPISLTLIAVSVGGSIFGSMVDPVSSMT